MLSIQRLIQVTLTSAILLCATSGCYRARPANSTLDVSKLPREVAILVPIGSTSGVPDISDTSDASLLQTLRFKAAPVGQFSGALIALINLGPYTATQLQVKTSLSEPFSFAGGTYPGSIPEIPEIPAGDCETELKYNNYCLMILKFAPTAEGTFTGKLSLSYMNGMITVPIEIDVQGATIANLVFDPAETFAFPDTTVGTTATAAFTITNTGSTAATEIRQYPDHEIAAPFAYTGGAYPGTGGTCGTTIEPGASCTVEISFAPNSAGIHAGELALGYKNGMDLPPGTPVEAPGGILIGGIGLPAGP